MIEIKLPESIKIGGFDYKVEITPERNAELSDEDCFGQHSERRRVLMFRNDLSPQQLSNTFIHEILHGVNAVYNYRKLNEEDVSTLTQGLFQILEQLGVRFVK